MLFKKLVEEIQVQNIVEAEVTEEERKDVETKVVFSNLVNDINDKIEVSKDDVLQDEKVAEDLETPKSEEEK